MEREILIFILSRRNRVSIRTLVHWRDRHYWDEVVQDDGEGVSNMLSLLLHKGYLAYAEFEDNASSWWGYYVTDTGIAYLNE
ncbi:hypothetical protein SAMN04487996_1389 [Dyadobacter soli]|uniref:Winged helix DNA-binding domain-containing protein n=1 Tax=Dyadobacter soli TaxID=659014 RepID=A0A1G8CIJ2_9BACT|nr:hypothetical protein SAMN04487996_1389 [Dyadobacter soli]